MVPKICATIPFVGGTVESHKSPKVIPKIIEFKSEGVSTLSGKKIWFDNTINRLNDESRGELLGEFVADDKILVITASGFYELFSYDLTNHFPNDMVLIEKYSKEKIITAVYFFETKKQFYIKRFIPEVKSKKTYFISQSKGSYLDLVDSSDNILIELSFVKPKNKTARVNELIDVNKFISVKGVSAIGNQLSRHRIKSVSLNVAKATNDTTQQIDDDRNNENQIKMNF